MLVSQHPLSSLHRLRYQHFRLFPPALFFVCPANIQIRNRFPQFPRASFLSSYSSHSGTSFINSSGLLPLNERLPRKLTTNDLHYILRHEIVSIMNSGSDHWQLRQQRQPEQLYRLRHWLAHPSVGQRIEPSKIRIRRRKL
jgi:hypothetical protein